VADVLPLFCSINDCPDRTDRLLGLVTGCVPVPEFFDFVAQKG
jgi:hypothetical protein